MIAINAIMPNGLLDDLKTYIDEINHYRLMPFDFSDQELT